MPEFAKAVEWFEHGAIFSGAILLIYFVATPAGRRQGRGYSLPEWKLQVSDFGILLCLFFSLMVFGALLGGMIAKTLELTGPAATIASGGGAQLGMLLSAAIFHFGFGHKLIPLVRSAISVLISSAITFLITVSVVFGVLQIWQRLLSALGIPAPSQDLVGIFAEVDSPVLLTVMLVFAVVVAPLAEEFIFRAGIFRYLRSRTPRAVAVLVPAVVFAAMHGNVGSFGPLVALAVIFSLVYERTGKISVTILAHALFNLNTLLVIFSGLNKVA